MNKVLSKVFAWLFVGLMVTFFTGLYVSNNPNMLYNIFSTSAYYLIFIAEIILVIFLSARINKMSFTTAMLSFLGYSVLSGLTFSCIFILFEISSILYVLGLTSIIFIILAIFGYFTKIDLSKLGNFLLIGLLAIILVSFINIFFLNAIVDTVVLFVGTLLFLIFIAYDIQRIKYLANSSLDENKVAIIGALELYLDFINLFIRLLQIFGNSKE